MSVTETVCNYLRAYDGKTGTNKKPQLLILGSGFDTLYWRLQGKAEEHMYERIFELDFPDVIARKSKIIAMHGLDDGGASLSAGSDSDSKRVALGVDLKDLTDTKQKLAASGFDFDAPTFVLSEVVLAYIPTSL